MPFLLITLTILNSFWFVFLQSLFVKHSNKFFLAKIINSLCPRHGIFHFFNHKNFCWPIWSETFYKNIFVFWYSNTITNFKFRIFINFFTRVNIYMFGFISTGLILIVLWYVQGRHHQLPPPPPPPPPHPLIIL